MYKLINQICKQTNLNTDQARMLLEHILQKSWAELISTEKPLNQKEQERLNQAIQEIVSTHKPLAYIIGNVPFLNLTIQTIPPILIPRHETEEFAATIIKKYSNHKEKIKKILDLATGSGCIALALAQHFPDAHVIGSDINPEAIILARKNAFLNNIQNVDFIESDLFTMLDNQKFDLIISNPPYIDTAKQNSLSSSVLKWEDHQALFAQDHGLQLIKKIIIESPQYIHLHNNLPFQLAIEIDNDQATSLISFAHENNWTAHAETDAFGQIRTLWCKHK